MTFDAYLRQPGSKRLTEISLLINVTKGRLSQLRKSEEWPPGIAMAVEHATDGAVDAAAISPIVAMARANG